ncbi:MAG: hypothetical protein ACYC0T_21740 [Ramlibacter sp.]
MQSSLKQDNALNGKKLIDFTAGDFWNLSLEKYRASKAIRKLVTKKKNHFDFNKLSEILETDRHYIYQVMMMNVKPSIEFLKKLQEVKNGYGIK